jgi:hypothetical protein
MTSSNWKNSQTPKALSEKQGFSFTEGEYMEEQEKEIKRGRKRFWVGFDIIFFGLCLLFAFVIGDPKGTILYYDGLHRTSRMFGIAFLVYPLTVLLISIFIVRIIFWKPSCKNKRNFWLLIKVGILCNPLIAPIYLGLLFPIQSPGYVSYTQGFHERMRRHLDIDTIRKWLETLDDGIFVSEQRMESSDEFIPVDILDSIPLKIFFHTFFKTEEGFNCIRISTSGGGISRLCGIVIGPEEMPIPPTEEAMYDEDDNRLKMGELRIKLADGAYVWHDMN